MMEELIKELIKQSKTLSVMESCTGGGLCNAITNIPNASRVFSYGAVTYSNEFKIKMGVSESIITQYSVYSKETAIDMAKTIQKYTNANYGVGITGKLKKSDDYNLYGDDDIVYLAIYSFDDNQEKIYCQEIKVLKDTREKNKQDIIDTFVKMMKKILINDNI